jgi:hypothetical protein
MSDEYHPPPQLPNAGLKCLHFNAGLGADLGSVAVMLESENATIFEDGNGMTSNTITLDAIALSARLNAGAVSPYLALVIPLDSDISDFFDFAVTAGAEIRL